MNLVPGERCKGQKGDTGARYGLFNIVQAFIQPCPALSIVAKTRRVVLYNSNYRLDPNDTSSTLTRSYAI